ncbi:TPA: hypothetical protein ACX6QG_003084 [Photobacterium damselae]
MKDINNFGKKVAQAILIACLCGGAKVLGGWLMTIALTLYFEPLLLSMLNLPI